MSKKAINERIKTDLDTGIQIEEKLYGECYENYQQREYMLKFINNKKRLKKEKEEEQRKTMIPQEILEDKNKNFIVSIFVITEQDIISFYGINMINSY